MRLCVSRRHLSLTPVLGSQFSVLSSPLRLCASHRLSSLFEHISVDCFHSIQHPLPSEQRRSSPSTGGPETAAQLMVPEKRVDCAGQLLRVAGRDNETSLA